MAAMLMGVWFRASRPICRRATWRGNPGIRERGAVQADFFVILVVVPLAAGVLLLGIAGRLCRLVHGRG
ncbi:MAG: hypothetical protein M3461_23430 [Pseudomonadota bacterium]|nr:hypothetical protein [Pseudomonadota bacterium]